jgi:hypothetical protein
MKPPKHLRQLNIRMKNTGCETWSLTLGVEHGWRVFDNRAAYASPLHNDNLAFTFTRQHVKGRAGDIWKE